MTDLHINILLVWSAIIGAIAAVFATAKITIVAFVLEAKSTTKILQDRRLRLLEELREGVEKTGSVIELKDPSWSEDKTIDDGMKRILGEVYEKRFGYPAPEDKLFRYNLRQFREHCKGLIEQGRKSGTATSQGHNEMDSFLLRFSDENFWTEIVVSTNESKSSESRFKLLDKINRGTQLAGLASILAVTLCVLSVIFVENSTSPLAEALLFGGSLFLAIAVLTVLMIVKTPEGYQVKGAQASRWEASVVIFFSTLIALSLIASLYFVMYPNLKNRTEIPFPEVNRSPVIAKPNQCCIDTTLVKRCQSAHWLPARKCYSKKAKRPASKNVHN